jgi:ATP-dependent DNA helicase RecG
LPRDAPQAEPDAKSAASNALASKLRKLGIRSDIDLALHLPSRYEDETALLPIASATPGRTCQVEGEVVDCELRFRPRRQLVCRIRDDSGQMALRFLNFYSGLQKQLQCGNRLRVFGEVRGGLWDAEMIHPRLRVVRKGEELPAALTPTYPTTAGLSQSVLRKLIDSALARVDLSETLPEAVLTNCRLPAFAASLKSLHHPEPDAPQAALSGRTDPAWRRIKFDELLAQQLSLRLAYAARRARAAAALSAGPRPLTQALLDSLPFDLTEAQRRAWAEIGRDLAQPHPMQRLLQGDVGSGKTVIAALAMLQAADAGYQAALMAPTEILAEQHFHKLSAWFAPLGVEIAWLAGALKSAEKQRIAAALATGSLRLVVGTHALIEENVSFAQLALAVVDEQHRFGVKQRLALRKKGGQPDAVHSGEVPHQLMMSATPIPRTLAMSFYADLDVSVIDELPPGRTPVLTKLVAEARRDEVIGRVRQACAQGRQAYWVCPLIEESEALQLKTAIETFERLKAELAELRVALVHGRLPQPEKARVMADFATGEAQLLVATTVIEVGVDVPNASLMVIEHAERFGLAQLHQLRGRVGRGSAESACILLYQGPLSESARARLKVIYESNDGFEVARRDLELRGPGEFIGARQSGIPWLRYADLSADDDLVQLASEIAPLMLKDYPQQARVHVARWLGSRQELLRA